MNTHKTLGGVVIAACAALGSYGGYALVNSKYPAINLQEELNSCKGDTMCESNVASKSYHDDIAKYKAYPILITFGLGIGIVTGCGLYSTIRRKTLTFE